jgi:hypothetical protein
MRNEMRFTFVCASISKRNKIQFVYTGVVIIVYRQSRYVYTRKHQRREAKSTNKYYIIL